MGELVNGFQGPVVSSSDRLRHSVSVKDKTCQRDKPQDRVCFFSGRSEDPH